MKPLSEFAEEWREYAKLTAACGSVTSGISAESLIRCANELQAWLRVADQEMALHAMAPDSVSTEWVRQDLLGTIQSSGEGKK